MFSLIPNYNVTDDVLRGLYENAKVRQALSVAIDRDTINELSYAGLGTPMQAAPVSQSPYYSADLAQHRAEYDPDLANQLLDEAGLTEKDADGYRFRPDGKRFTIVVQAGDSSYSPVLEQVRQNWHGKGRAQHSIRTYAPIPACCSRS